MVQKNEFRNLRITSQRRPVADLRGNSWRRGRRFTVPEEVQVITCSTNFGFVARTWHIAIRRVCNFSGGGYSIIAIWTLRGPQWTTMPET
jgi:hypothetical protein